MDSLHDFPKQDPFPYPFSVDEKPLCSLFMAVLSILLQLQFCQPFGYGLHLIMISMYASLITGRVNIFQYILDHLFFSLL